jgi:DnaJ domain
LLTKEALDVLALRPGATPAEIKEAYRDLVKVWHPDRFGSDPGLRQKAEDKLKRINQAYTVLQSDRTGGTPEPDEAAGSMPGDARWRWSSSSAPRTYRGGRGREKGISRGIGWVYGYVGIALGLMAGYMAIEHGTMRGGRPASAPVQQVEALSEQTAPTISAIQAAGGELAAGSGGPVDLQGQNGRGKNSGRSKPGSSAEFHVRVLSNAEMAQLESACSWQEKMQDAAGYQSCVREQIDLITNAGGAPDLSLLSEGERESIESVCAEAKRSHGTDGYRRCLITQMAQLAAEPARPDLSGLKEEDRSSIEAACRKAKYQEGPAVYQRCREGLVELLAKSK